LARDLLLRVGHAAVIKERNMKIGIYADAHYSSRKLSCGVRKNSESLRKLREAYTFFREEGCELVISMGDLIDCDDTHEKERNNLGQIAALIREFGLRTYCVMGNHDGFAFTQEAYFEILGENCRPEDLDTGNAHLLFLDACYFKNGKRYAPGDTDWTDTFYPFADDLKRKLETLQGEVYVFLHQNLDPSVHESHRLFNESEIRRILEESGKVKTVYQGHYHPGNDLIHNGIRYLSFPALCEEENRYYIAEL